MVEVILATFLYVVAIVDVLTEIDNYDVNLVETTLGDYRGINITPITPVIARAFEKIV